MPAIKTTKTKKPVKPTKAKKNSMDEELIKVEDPEEGEVEPDEELDPEVIEALKLKAKKTKKPSSGLDYIPELERGEIDLDAALDDNY